MEIKRDALLAELAEVEFESEAVAHEARERMHHDGIDVPVAIAGSIDHRLKHWPFVIHRGSAGLGILADDGIATRP